MKNNQTGVSHEMKTSPFHQLFLDNIKDIYWAENALVKALPKMQKAATSDKLKDAIGNHLLETENHVERLKRVFALLDEEPEEKKCDAMAGLIKEANELVDETKDDTFVRDSAIILAAQKIEHYEIATYGSLRVWANIMEHTEVESLLSETLSEEKNADTTLTDIAEQNINQEASEE